MISCFSDVLFSALIDVVAAECCVPCDKFVLLRGSKVMQGPGSLGGWRIERARDCMVDPEFRVSGIVPGASVVGAGTLNSGASGVEPAGWKVRHCWVGLCMGTHSPTQGLAEAKALGKRPALSPRENKATRQASGPPAPESTQEN